MSTLLLWLLLWLSLLLCPHSTCPKLLKARSLCGGICVEVTAINICFDSCFLAELVISLWYFIFRFTFLVVQNSCNPEWGKNQEDDNEGDKWGVTPRWSPRKSWPQWTAGTGGPSFIFSFILYAKSEHYDCNFPTQTQYRKRQSGNGCPGCPEVPIVPPAI